ncbi:Oxygen-independent coproporphyrinogen III oxidase [Croceitalea dokdonensis DOKDO 023]|uniref:Heme chaperone HemW n=1 Tax=Croceitalea dokdonensis DOKDO 023 TaxID=1300341 RepID=A0A0P7AT98_9FLAO|nr:radical SAM family heme chaperone HemW [Croceitalea dokdonensis]KPM31175.1 Oxygen-independent coproporphyrinogen III oxidase [Croceitalea dokdonensis DOKDO 023]
MDKEHASAPSSQRPLSPDNGGIYIHIPFCKQACHYCDFHFSTNFKKKTELLDALAVELAMRSAEFKGTTVATIYFGGGTPSVLSVKEIGKLVNTVYTHYKVEANPEITLEANPDDLSKEKLRELSASTINRLSIGIQSFFEDDLKLMNRAHNSQQAMECLFGAKAYFDNISIDLIYGIPGMSDARWLKNIETALEFNIPHISSYALTVEPKTALKAFIEKGVVDDVDDETAQRHFEMLNNTLTHAGFTCYEISNFGKPGFFSKNNTAYWQQKKYIGIGPSAHSYDGNRRGWNINNNSKYINALAQRQLPIEIEELTLKDRYNEYVMTGLRTIWGVSLSKIEGDFGNTYLDYLMQQANKYLEGHLLYLDGDTLLATKKGRFLADGIASDLFMLNLSGT